MDGASGLLDGAIQDATDAWNEGTSQSAGQSTSAVSLDDIPEFSDSPYVTVNDNIPYFTKDDLTTEAFETYPSWMTWAAAASHMPMCVRS